MVYVLIDDWLYMDADGKQGRYGRQEFELHAKSNIKTLSVAFLDYQTKRVQEGLIDSAFEKENLTAQEKISSHSIQMIGVKEEKIKEIYDYFHGLRVESLVPYGVAIRALLKSRDILNSHPYIIFLDDLGSQAVMSIFEGMYFSSPRRISMRDVGYMTSEMKRSWQGFIADKEHRVGDTFTLVSNNKEWLAAFVEQGFCLKENIVHVDVSFAALEGLKSAKFTMHFVLAKEVLKHKKFKKWQDRLKFLIICLMLILLGLGFYLGAKVFENQRLSHYKILMREESGYKQQLKELYQDKFMSFLQRNKTLDYAKIYYDFIKSVPEGYAFDNLQFQKVINNDFWQVQGVVYPQDEYANQAEFQYQSSFSDAQASSIIVNKVLGQRINIVIDTINEDL